MLKVAVSGFVMVTQYHIGMLRSMLLVSAA